LGSWGAAAEEGEEEDEEDELDRCFSSCRAAARTIDGLKLANEVNSSLSSSSSARSMAYSRNDRVHAAEECFEGSVEASLEQC
jgi:hypothetical protein